MRLPSLIAGTATIPLVYLVGARTLNKTAGADRRGGDGAEPVHDLLLGRGAHLRADDRAPHALDPGAPARDRERRARWWVVYAICSCGALYSHYTSVFVLAAQVLWVVWKHREALRACILANVAVAVGFAPWLPGFVADNDSPTTDILDLLQPFNLDAVANAIENWAVGYPYIPESVLPGTVAR